MKIPNELLCLFSADVDERDDSYTITIPEQEVATDDVDSDGVYRVALLETTTTDIPLSDETTSDAHPVPPVNIGERRTVEIEDIGEQGDGIARVEHGYVIIVPKTEEGERVIIEITDVSPNVAFGEVVEPATDEKTESN